MDHTHGGCATTKSFHLATFSAQRICFTRVLLARLTMVVELSLYTGIPMPSHMGIILFQWPWIAYCTYENHMRLPKSEKMQHSLGLGFKGLQLLAAYHT